MILLRNNLFTSTVFSVYVKSQLLRSSVLASDSGQPYAGEWTKWWIALPRGIVSRWGANWIPRGKTEDPSFGSYMPAIKMQIQIIAKSEAFVIICIYRSNSFGID